VPLVGPSAATAKTSSAGPGRTSAISIRATREARYSDNRPAISPGSPHRANCSWARAWPS